jgi:hypothetical protein
LANATIEPMPRRLSMACRRPSASDTASATHSEAMTSAVNAAANVPNHPAGPMCEWVPTTAWKTTIAIAVSRQKWPTLNVSFSIDCLRWRARAAPPPINTASTRSPGGAKKRPRIRGISLRE